MQCLQRFIRCDSGATSIEYALIASLISIVILGVVTAIGTKLRTKFTNVSTALGS